eukprot:scaffold119645_cov54-Phaeocystis_antarctica.AAC.2
MTARQLGRLDAEHVPQVEAPPAHRELPALVEGHVVAVRDKPAPPVLGPAARDHDQRALATDVGAVEAHAGECRHAASSPVGGEVAGHTGLVHAPRARLNINLRRGGRY